MAFRLEHGEALDVGVRRLAGEALDDAISRLAAAQDEPDALEGHVHEVRKRCKEVRALLRLVRPALGRRARAAEVAVADAARRLAGVRDAQAVLATLDDLAAAHAVDASAPLRAGALAAVRAGQAAAAQAAASAVADDGDLLVRVRDELVAVRAAVPSWDVPDRFGSIAAGLERTYRDGRQAMRTAADDGDDEAVHEWRSRAKRLWYQLRVLQAVAPSVLRPVVDALDDIGEALGDDHDLSVLVGHMRADPERYGGAAAVELVADLARREQDELRTRAFRSGARIWAERPDAFTDRIRAYWKADRRVGRELRTGGIDDLADERREDRGPPPPSSTVEHERKFLVRDVPPLDGAGVALRQGYVALDGTVAVRVRAEGDDRWRLTIKGGRGASRTEVEWPMERAAFDALWALTGERRVEKVRHRIPLDGGVVAELDVFAGALDGLVLVEVELPDAAALEAFRPPGWFGDEVTDDDRWSNAALALGGLPAGGVSAPSTPRSTSG